MTEKQNFGEKLVTVKPGHAYYSKLIPVVDVDFRFISASSIPYLY